MRHAASRLMPVCVSRCLFVIPHIPSFHPNGVRLVKTQNLASPVLSTPLHAHDIPTHPSRFPPCETQDFASLLSLPCDIILRKPSFHPNGVRLVETQNLASPVLSTPLHAHDIPTHPSRFPPCETQDFASLLSLPCDIILRKPSFHPNGVRLVETQNLASPVLSTPLHAHDIPTHPSRFPPCETQDFASLLSLPCDIILRKPSFHPNGVRLVETQNLASPVLSTPLHAHDIPTHPSRFPPCETQDFASLLLCGHVVSLLPRHSLTLRQA